MKMYGYIYLTICKLDNSVYVGQKKSCKFLNNYYGSGTIIKSKLKKYGKEHFETTIICKATNREALDLLEIFFINKFRKNHNCMNLVNGGIQNTLGYSLSNKQKETMRKSCFEGAKKTSIKCLCFDEVVFECESIRQLSRELNKIGFEKLTHSTILGCIRKNTKYKNLLSFIK